MTAEVSAYVAAGISLAGVLVGVLLKALMDLLTESSRRRREDRIRFLSDRRQVYLDYVTAVRDVRDAVTALHRTEVHEARAAELLTELKAAKRARRKPDPALLAEGADLEERMEFDEELRALAITALDGGLEQRLNMATLELELLAPPRVLDAAALVPPAFAARDPEALDVAADRVIEAARDDLRRPMGL